MKRIFLALAAVLLLMTVEPKVSAAAAKSGKCGKNVSWTYAGGTLTISGKGDMRDYRQGTFGYFRRPWDNFGNNVKKIVIKNGVTSVGISAFENFGSLKTVKFASSVKSIGDGAFTYCASLKSVKLPSGVTYIGEDAFATCRSLKSVTMPSKVEFIGNYAFYGCPSLKSIRIPPSVKTSMIASFGYYTEGGDEVGFVKVPGFTIIGQKGSKAELYAKLHGFKFKTEGSSAKPSTVKIKCPSRLTVKIGRSETLKPSSSADRKFTYKSSNSKIVSVNKNGRITAKKAGKVTITVTGKTSKKTAKCVVTVPKNKKKKG